MYGDKWASGTSHSIIVVNVVVILLSFCRWRSFKIFGRGAVLHVSAPSPRWRQRCSRRRPLPIFFAVQLAASGAADGCSRRPTIPRPQQLAERTRHGDTAGDETTALATFLAQSTSTDDVDCGECRESLSHSIVFSFAFHSDDLSSRARARDQCDQFPRVLTGMAPLTAY